jgi:hypothetical protein
MTTPTIPTRPIAGAPSASGTASSSRRGAASSAGGADAGRRFADLLEDDAGGDDALSVSSAGPTASAAPRSSVRQRHADHQDSKESSSDDAHKKTTESDKDGTSLRADLHSHPMHERIVTPVDEVKSPRAILPPADLSQIVTAVRTDAFLNGGHEISIQLSNSVLNGLQIKLASDANGRIKAELIAPNEQAKFHLDQRFHELTDMLRARGVDVAELKTSVGSHGSHDADARQRREDRFAERVAASRASGRGNAVPALEPTPDIPETTATDAELTYNA